MYLFCQSYISSSSINLETIIAIVDVIITAFLTYIIIRQTKEISEQQTSQQENISCREAESKKIELKILLYDKRYKVYECFQKYNSSFIYDFDFSVKNISSPFGVFTKSEFLNTLIFNNISNDNRKREIDKAQELSKKIEKQSNMILKKEMQEDLDKLNNNMLMENVEMANEDQRILENSKFCFPEEISTIVIKYVKCLHDYCLPLNIEKDKIEKELVSYINELKEKKVVEKMEELLRIDYNKL